MDEGEKQITWEEMCQQYDREHESGSSMDWGEMMELSESVRMPGRALELHNKLSSPSRKKSRSESVKRSEERMVRNYDFFFIFIPNRKKELQQILCRCNLSAVHSFVGDII